jgi:TrmH family RNA methyltransferase
MKEISSASNPRVKEWAQLLDKKGREKQGKFIVEGTHLVSEAIQSGAAIDCAVYAADRGIPREISQETHAAIEWIGVSSAVFNKCTDTVTPQGVFAVVHKLTADAQRVIHHPNPLVIAIDGIQDPGNLGTIIRSADAVGATGVVIGKGSVDLYNPKTVRSTMGSLFHLPIIEGDLQQILAQVQSLPKPVQMMSTSLQAESLCYDEDFTQGVWIVVGNEGQGVSPEISGYVDRKIKIPMAGQAESLNVAMATTILLYEALRQRNYNS